MRDPNGRPEPLRVRNLIARKIGENCQVLRWDNNQYQRTCGYRFALSASKNGRSLWQAEWPIEAFPRRATHHNLILWLENVQVHSRIVFSVSAHSSERHGVPMPIHLASWYKEVTTPGVSALHDPRAPQLLISDPDEPSDRGIDLMQDGVVVTWYHNCSVDELTHSSYSEVWEERGEHWVRIPRRVVKNNRVGGHESPRSVPSRPEELFLDVPLGNPEVSLRSVDEDLWVKTGEPNFSVTTQS